MELRVLSSRAFLPRKHRLTSTRTIVAFSAKEIRKNKFSSVTPSHHPVTGSGYWQGFQFNLEHTTVKHSISPCSTTSATDVKTEFQQKWKVSECVVLHLLHHCFFFLLLFTVNILLFQISLWCLNAPSCLNSVFLLSFRFSWGNFLYLRVPCAVHFIRKT